MDYDLYAVVVHHGQHYNSGHYYSFINSSSDLDSPCWIKFDDSRVYAASERQTLDFTGGKRKTKGWNSEFDRFLEREYTAEDTAYVLVYYRREVFREYQKNEVNIPRQWMTKRSQMRAEEKAREE